MGSARAARGGRLLAVLLLAVWLAQFSALASGSASIDVYVYSVAGAAERWGLDAARVDVGGVVVPAYVYFVLLPPSTERVGVECSFTPLGSEPLPGGPPAAPPPAGPHGVDYDAFKAPRLPAPGSCAELLGPYRGPGDSLVAILRVYPVVYGEGRVVYGEARATVKAYYTPTSGRAAVPGWLLGLASNPVDAARWYRLLDSEGYAILLGDPGFEDEVLPLARLRAAQGYTVSVYDLDYVTSNYPAGTVQESLREFARSLRELGYTHLLIVGDAELVPPAYFYMEDALYYEDEYKATDLYYSLLDGDWDPDGDGKLLETVDTDGDGRPESILEPLPDLVPDLLVGRLPASSEAELEAMISGVLRWETRGPPHAPSMLLAAAILNYEGEDGENWPKTDAAAVAHWVATDVIPRQSLGSPVDYQRLYEDEGLDPSSYPHEASLTYTSVYNELSWGYTYLASSAHGNVYGQYRKVWAQDDGDGVPEEGEMEAPAYIYSSGLPPLPGPLVAYLAACQSGYFDYPYSDSLAEELLEAGAAAVVASTRISYYQVGWSEPGGWFDQELEYLFWEHLLAGDHASVGEALYASKAEYLARVGSYMIYADLKVSLEYVLLGDPALRRYTDPSLAPQLSAEADGLAIIAAVTREGLPLQGALVALVTPDGLVVDTAYTGQDGVAVLSAPSPGAYYVYALAGASAPVAVEAVEASSGGGGGGAAPAVFRAEVVAPPLARPGSVARVLVLFECNGSLALPDDYSVAALPGEALVGYGAAATPLGPVVEVNVSIPGEGQVAVLAWGRCGNYSSTAAGYVYFADYATSRGVSEVSGLVSEAAGNVTGLLEAQGSLLEEILEGLGNVSEGQAAILERLASILEGLADLEEGQSSIAEALEGARGEIAGLILDVNETVVTLMLREAGLVRAGLEDLNATLTGVAGRLALVDTKLGVALADLSEILQGVEALGDGQLEIKTLLGSVNASLSGLDARLAGVEEGVLIVNTSIGRVLVVLEDQSAGLEDVKRGLIGVAGAVAVIKSSLEELAPRITAIEGAAAYVNTTLGLVKADLGVLLNQSSRILGLAGEGSSRLLAVETALGNLTVLVEGITEDQARVLDSLAGVSASIEEIRDSDIPQVTARLDAILFEVRNGTSEVLLKLNVTGREVLVRLGEAEESIAEAVAGLREECRSGSWNTTVAVAGAAALAAAAAALVAGRLR